MPPPGKKKTNLVHQLESHILGHSRLTKLSVRKDASYFGGRAGVIRILNLIFSATAVGLLFPGFWPVTLDEKNEDDAEAIRMMGGNSKFKGYRESKYTMISMALGVATAFISLVYILLLYFFLEVRCDILWERVNQKIHVIACILSVCAGFMDVLSIEEIQRRTCKTTRCKEEEFNTRVTRFEQEFYPPYFIYHYIAFVMYLTNAMLYSVASRIWLRNSD